MARLFQIALKTVKKNVGVIRKDQLNRKQKGKLSLKDRVICTCTKKHFIT